MRKVRLGVGKGVLVDACKRGDGLWFDGGEVDQLVKLLSEKSPAKAGHSEVFNFIREVLKVK
jgi:Zn-finger nucleic acid-binding protein